MGCALAIPLFGAISGIGAGVLTSGVFVAVSGKHFKKAGKMKLDQLQSTPLKVSFSPILGPQYSGVQLGIQF
jgi:hypothetical protein